MAHKARFTDIQRDFGRFCPSVDRLAVQIVEQGRISLALGLDVLEARMSSVDLYGPEVDRHVQNEGTR